MIVSDVMTRTIVSIPPDALVEEAASLMLERRISGVLVVQPDGHLAGILSEGDLLHRNELGTQPDRPWWLRLLVSPAQQASEFVQAHGRYVRDVMTGQVVTVAEDAALEDVVALMERHRIKRVPVTRDGRVVGVVSRSDLLRLLVDRSRGAAPPTADDDTIREHILEALEAQPWAPTTTLSVAVSNGAVELSGSVTDENERRGIRVIAENAPGVKQVDDHMVLVEPFTGTVIDAPDDKP